MKNLPKTRIYTKLSETESSGGKRGKKGKKSKAFKNIAAESRSKSFGKEKGTIGGRVGEFGQISRYEMAEEELQNKREEKKGVEETQGLG